MSQSLLELREQLVDSKFLRELHATQPTRRGLREVADFGLVMAGLITRGVGHHLMQGAVGRGREIPSERLRAKMERRVVAVTSNMGFRQDRDSNSRMLHMCGPLFKGCFDVMGSVMDGGRHWRPTYPRAPLSEDWEKAEQVDRALTVRTASYFQRPDGLKLLKKPLGTYEGDQGCPLMRAPRPDNTFFDQVCLTMVDEYLDPDSPFFRKGYYGFAEYVVREAGVINARYEEMAGNPDYERARIAVGYKELDWALPQI